MVVFKYYIRLLLALSGRLIDSWFQARGKGTQYVPLQLVRARERFCTGVLGPRRDIFIFRRVCALTKRLAYHQRYVVEFGRSSSLDRRVPWRQELDLELVRLGR